MKIAHISLENILEFDESRMISWVFEDPQVYYQYVQELSKQTQGELGNFVVSDKGRSLKCDSDVQMIIGPFDIALNSKKISTLITKKLLKVAVENSDVLKFKQVSKSVSDYIFDLLQESNLPVEMDEFEENDLIKAVLIKTKESDKFIENLTNYIDLILNLSSTKLLVLVDITPYIDLEYFDKFINFLMYQDINVLFVDFMKQDKMHTFAKTYFLDSDKCEFIYSKDTFVTK